MKRPREAAHRQRGAALAFVLVFLLVLTTLALASLTDDHVEARAVYTASDYQRALQAADSAAAEGERWLDAQAARPTAVTCALPCPDAPLVWAAGTPAPEDGAGFDWTLNALDFSLDYSGSVPQPRTDAQLLRVYQSPRYVIEEIGPGLDGSLVLGQSPPSQRWFYRITAQGTGAQPGTTATVESVYVRRY